MVHKEYNKASFLYKANTKGKDQSEQNNVCTKCLDVYKAHCK